MLRKQKLSTITGDGSKHMQRKSFYHVAIIALH